MENENLALFETFSLLLTLNNNLQAKCYCVDCKLLEDKALCLTTFFKISNIRNSVNVDNEGREAEKENESKVKEKSDVLLSQAYPYLAIISKHTKAGIHRI